MTKKPTVGKYYDANEQALIESIESDDAQFESVLNDERIKEIRQIYTGNRGLVPRMTPFSKVRALCFYLV